MLKTTINNSYDFKELFIKKGRGGQFSANGFYFLFNYLEQLSDDLNSDIEIDVIELCCAYTEYSSIEEALKETGCEDIEELRDTGVVIEFDDGIIIS